MRAVFMRWLVARDLQILEVSDYQRLNEDVTEVKRMLAAFINKLKADSWLPIAED